MPNRRYESERGQALPLIIVMFIVLCGFVGLTIDVGYGLLQKRRLQAAVDMGALSGAQKLPGTDAGADAASFTRANFKLASDQAVNVTATTSCMVAGCTVPRSSTSWPSSMSVVTSPAVRSALGPISQPSRPAPSCTGAPNILHRMKALRRSSASVKP